MADKRAYKAPVDTIFDGNRMIAGRTYFLDPERVDGHLNAGLLVEVDAETGNPVKKDAQKRSGKDAGRKTDR